MITDRLKKLAPFAWFLPGFLLWAAYPPMGERADVLFALAPLMWLARREPIAATVAKRWFQSGVFYWVATLSWMPAIVKNGGPWPLVVLGWFALAAYCAAYFAACGYLSARYWSFARARGGYGWRLFGVLLVEPVLWCGLELVRSRLGGGVAWNHLGVVPANSGFAGPAAFGGVYLLSAVVILVNGTIAGIAERMWKPERSGFSGLRRLGFVETVSVFAIVWGLYSVDGRPAAALDVGGPSLKVAMIQRNFPCVFKQQEENPYAVYERLLGHVAALKPDLVVLSESAMCEFGPVDQQGAVRFAAWLHEKTGAALLAGGTRYEEGHTYNSAALYQWGRTEPSPLGPRPPSEAVDGPQQPSLSVQFYDKVHLVPFGEFIPGDKWFPALQKLAPVGSCTPGKLTLHNLVPRPSSPVPVGVAICFEDTDSAQMRELARQGAKVLFFVTNDSWFSHSVEPEQHAWQAVARAVETGLPVVRVGNSGVTGTILPDGRATWLVGADGRAMVDAQGSMLDRVPLGAADRASTSLPRTAYVVLGDWPLGIIFALLMMGMIVVKYRDCYEKRRRMPV